ncbi:MAG: SDR family NAD(P)-dependent oxidoreductase [Halobacteriaceae archaeon]
MTAPDLTGRVGVVTGAASGIGRQTAAAMAERGASLVLADLDADGGEAAAEELAAEHDVETAFVRTDVTELDDTEEMVRVATGEFGRLDLAFNNAGIEGASAPTGEYDPEEWQRVVDVNLTGVWNSLRAELPAMVDGEDDAAIVNTSSILGKVGFAGAPAYTAAKHGVVGLTKNAALEYATQGIRVNAVCPGFVHTPMIERYGVTEDPELQAEIEGRHAMERLGRPEEIAAAVVWLLSDAASFVTGEAVDVDGGYLSR